MGLSDERNFRLEEHKRFSLQRLHASPIQGQYRMRGLHPGALFATFMASEAVVTAERKGQGLQNNKSLKVL